MIVFKEEETVERKEANTKSEMDFQFYTVVNNLSAVEHLPKSFMERFFDGIKNFFYRSK